MDCDDIIVSSWTSVVGGDFGSLRFWPKKQRRLGKKKAGLGSVGRRRRQQKIGAAASLWLPGSSCGCLGESRLREGCGLESVAERGSLVSLPQRREGPLLSGLDREQRRGVGGRLEGEGKVSPAVGWKEKGSAVVFSLAYKLQPAFILIDEVDSFLGQRRTTDHEALTNMKTKFMALWNGFTTDPSSSAFEIGIPNQRERAEILKVVLKRGENRKQK
uniref:ATPase AAA-type core domain-containing protein n=1 Tax=Populus trichocarpa TaxID=3694 RepID=A0A2K1YFZ1_POPTR